MAHASEFTFTRYLSAKRTVDDRALNQHVWQSLQRELAALVHAGPRQEPLAVLEIGAGIGTMIERAVEWSLFPDGAPIVYSALDADPANITAAHARLRTRPAPFPVALETGDLLQVVERAEHQQAYHLVIAHAFLDLLDLDSTLPRIVKLLRPGGLLYVTINFDGATILQPEIDRALDDQIEACYHATMDNRITDGRPSGDSRTGRHLFGAWRQAGATILAAGASDWVVFAGPDGYPADEAYFLHFIIQTMQGALRDDPALDGERFAAWIDRRHQQIERGELVYIAHQIDFLCRVAP